jgi:hypothetical protein
VARRSAPTAPLATCVRRRALQTARWQCVLLATSAPQARQCAAPATLGMRAHSRR